MKLRYVHDSSPAGFNEHLLALAAVRVERALTDSYLLQSAWPVVRMFYSRRRFHCLVLWLHIDCFIY
jgi:hypothetical protein